MQEMNTQAFFFEKYYPLFAGGDFLKNPQGLSFRIHLHDICFFSD